MAGLLDYDDLRNEYSAFFGLLFNDRGVRLRLNLPDTLVVQRGQPLVWLATNQDGYVVPCSASSSSWENVRQHLLSCALDGSGRYAPYVAVMRGEGGLPRLLTRQALDMLCIQLAEQLETGEAGSKELCLLQAYVAPFLDLRLVTAYTNDGASTSCHTFQRRFSRRYLPHRAGAQPLSPGTLAGSSQDAQPVQAEAAAAASRSGQLAGSGPAAAVDSEAAVIADASGDATGEVLLDDGALADSERNLAKTVGTVDPNLKMLARKAAHSVVQYVQKAHLLTLRGLVCEFVRDGEGLLWFLGPLRADWASLVPGRGGEPWANANLTQQPQDEESWPLPTSNGGAEQAEEEQPVVGTQPEVADSQPFPPQQQKRQPGEAGLPAGTCLLPGLAAERSAKRAGTLPTRIMDQLLPAPALPPVQPGREQPGSPAIPALLVVPGTAEAPASDKPAGSPASCALRSPQQMAMLKAAPRRSPGAGVQKERWSPGACAVSAIGGRKGQASLASTAGGGPAWAGSSCAPPRGAAAVLASHLTKELESLRDDLLVKTDLADELASKVQALEHDKHVITSAFEQVVEGMQGDLREVKGRLEALRLERDRLASQLAEAEQKLASTEAERERLQGILNVERGTAFESLGQFQKQQEEASLQAVQAEAELRLAQEQLKEEQAAVDALKKQMVFYQGLVCDGCGGAAAEGGRTAAPRAPQERPELKYADTLQAVEELLMREVDPTGERYSLSKVLHTCQGDLHAIFLHYCMLDPGFVRHWPPQLTLSGWLAFMKDIGSTNLVPGTRTRSDNTMHVQEATEVFRRYCLRQAVMKGAAPARALSTMRDSLVTPATSAVLPAGAATASDQPTRPPSSQSVASAAPTARPFSAVAAQLAGATMSYQSFCAALVHVAAKVSRGSPEALEACPFLSEQTRAFVDSILPKAQQVSAIAQTVKKAGGAAGAGSPKQAAQGGMGAKEAAAKEAAAKLPKLKQPKAKAGAGAGAEMSAIAEASREGSSLHQAPGAGDSSKN